MQGRAGISGMGQSLVAEDFRGRVMSVHQLNWGATALGGMLIGFLAQLGGAPFALTLAGLITALFAGGLALAKLGELARATQATALELSADTHPARAIHSPSDSGSSP